MCKFTESGTKRLIADIEEEIKKEFCDVYRKIVKMRGDEENYDSVRREVIMTGKYFIKWYGIEKGRKIVDELSTKVEEEVARDWTNK